MGEGAVVHEVGHALQSQAVMASRFVLDWY
jgi:Zn-dependent membrane protease YugP